MVLATFGPSVSVDPNGPNQQSAMRHAPTSQGGTVIEEQDNGDLQAAIQIAGPAVALQTNPWQEFNEFIGEMCRIYTAATGVTIAPAAMVVRVADMCAAWSSQTYHA